MIVTYRGGGTRHCRHRTRLRQSSHRGNGRLVMNFSWLAWANFLLGVIFSHQSLGFVNGFNLLLQGDVGLCCLLCTSHASRVAIPGNLKRKRWKNSKLTSTNQVSFIPRVQISPIIYNHVLTFSSGFWISSSPIFLPMAVSSTPKISVRLSASCFKLLSISRPGA